jgi:hypothetical protein
MDSLADLRSIAACVLEQVIFNVTVVRGWAPSSATENFNPGFPVRFEEGEDFFGPRVPAPQEFTRGMETDLRFGVFDIFKDLFVRPVRNIGIVEGVAVPAGESRGSATSK